MPEKTCLIIGSGMGGLATAVLLTKAGYQVTVLEAHPSLVGGYAQTIGDGKYHFSAGPRYLWNFGPDEPGDRFLRKCGLKDQVPMVQLDRNGFDRIYVENDEPIVVPNGWTSFAEILKQRFPNEAARIDKFFQLCEETFKIFEFAEHKSLALESRNKLFAKYALSGRMKPAEFFTRPTRMSWTLQRAFDHCRLSPRLQTVLAGHGMIFALPKESLSFYAYVAASLFYHRGCYYPLHDMNGMVSAMVAAITAGGGTVRTGCRVTSVKSDQSGITAAVTESGESFTADTFVANIDPRRFVSILDPAAARCLRLPPYEYSLSLTSFFLGLSDASVLKEHFGPWNVWYAKEIADQRSMYVGCPRSEPPALYVNSPSLVKNPDSLSDSCAATVTAFVPSSYEAFSRPDGDVPRSRLAAMHRDAVLDLIEKRFIPRLRSVMEYCEFRTPLDNAEILSAPQGNVYGRRLTPNGAMQNISWKTKIPNLYFVGSVVGFAGIASVIHNACVVYEELTGDRGANRNKSGLTLPPSVPTPSVPTPSVPTPSVPTPSVQPPSGSV